VQSFCDLTGIDRTTDAAEPVEFQSAVAALKLLRWKKERREVVRNVVPLRAMRPRLIHFIGPAALVSMLVSGCGEGSRGVSLLPSPPPERMQISKSQSETPFVQAGAGALARSSFATSVAGYAVEVRDFLVGPAQNAVSVDMTGAAVFEVRDGTGTVTIGEKTAAVSMGATFTVSEGEKLRIEARGGPFVLRAHMFKAEQ